MSKETSGGGCRISVVDNQYSPTFEVAQAALSVPGESDRFQKAYFAMGCFWGSEALLAGAPGVVSTRVGFAGGTLENPTYRSIGDHVETVEVLYDPDLITYPELLRHFWRHHNARAKPIFRQYASAVFAVDESQEKAAKKERRAWQQKTGGDKLLTAVLPIQKFYPAGESHQKYYLQQDPPLLESLPDGEQKLNTLLATKLNAVAGRGGERESLEKTLAELGINPEARDLLFLRAVWEQ